jgi:hypothetical protein
MAAPTQPSPGPLAAELSECRQRGLDRLDIDTPSQSSVPAPTLTQLAADYCTHAAITVHGRIPAVTRLLRDALTSYEQAGNHANARLITDLFFADDPTATPVPGQLLDRARKSRGVTDDKKFRDDRRRAFADFAQFLTAYSERAATASHQRRRRRLAVIATSVVVLIASGLTAWIITSNTGDAAAVASTSSAAPTTTNPPPAPGSTHPEVVNSAGNARTYRNPRDLIGEGPRITNHTTVQVSCVITATLATSAGKYWYRVVTLPWGNQYYSPANSYLNGDPQGGPYTHAVDPAVPNCPP